MIERLKQHTKDIGSPNLLLLFGMCAALSFCLFQAHQNRKISRWLSSYGGTLSGPARAMPGDLVPPFSASYTDGDGERIYYGEGANCRLFQIFSPDCRACNIQMRTWWPRIDGESKGAMYVDSFAISIGTQTETDALITQNPAISHALMMPSGPIRRAYRVTSIPELLLVNPGGEVEWTHYGILNEVRFEELAIEISKCSQSAVQRPGTHRQKEVI